MFVSLPRSFGGYLGMISSPSYFVPAILPSSSNWELPKLTVV
jgi:hypothetical protein